MTTVDTNETAAVIVAVYADKDEAEAALSQLREMQKEHLISLLEAAVVYKNLDGKIFVSDTADPGTKKGTAAGVVVGGILGVIFPPSIIVSAIGGGAVGALYGHFSDKGMRNSELERAGNDLQPGQAGLIAVVIDRFADQIKTGLAGYAKLDSYLLDAESSATVLGAAQAD